MLTKGAGLYEAMDFRFDWRKYQRMVLDLFEHRDPTKRTFHVVSPPGSGKTLVGIEIARRIGLPAVTFSPTTTIQEQWREKVRLFLPEGDEQTDALAQVSTDSARLGTISNLTYQSLSTQSQEREFLDRLGLAAWRRELVEEGGRSEESTDAYLADILQRSEQVYRRQLSKHALREKRRALESGEVDLHDLLHPNAIDLIERIAAAGTGCVIFDEAHHLLDYWALILADLVARLPNALVVGLTATPPASTDPDEMG
ncbi:MAG: DEAD/DEAH box helicase family protein, partial [Chloroflexi bacterium]|nr:DEAD/DEAH box helicase family protein [Chloroflexota bacterium]